MTYTEQHPKLSTKTTFSTFTEKYYPYISYIYTNKCKEPIHKNDVGKISTPFRIRIKDNCKLHTQRPSKVPIHHRDRLNKLLLELEKYNIMKQIGSTSDEKHTIGTTFLNPLIIIPKGDAIKSCLRRKTFKLKHQPRT